MSKPEYLLDANVFIQAARTHYAFDIAPAFWDALVEESNAGRIASIDRVKDELERGNDDLADWARNSFHQAFLATDTDNDVITGYGELIQWSQGQAQYLDPAKQEFARVADTWLIAYARAKGITIVTQETFNPDIKRKIPIPNVCRAFTLPYIDLFQMMRNLGIKLG